MAEGKKSFVAYCDWGAILNELPDDKAGQLAKHLFNYVNDKNPETDDILIKVAFAGMKSTLKRDLDKYENIVERNRSNGKKGGRPKKDATLNEPKKPSGLNGNPKEPKKPDSESDLIVKVELNNSTSYTEKEFLKDWNRLRIDHLKKPSFLNSMSRDEAETFKDLKTQYTQEHFQQALIGLFKQKKMPNGNSTMQSSPKHFLSYFNSYLTAYHDKNTSLYGKPELEKTM